MTNEEIVEGNKIIAEFMGGKLDSSDAKYYYFPEKGNYEIELKYYSSWDWLMPACKKWDNLYIDMENEILMDYRIFSDKLDDTVTCYDQESIFHQLVENIKWFNEIKEK